MFEYVAEGLQPVAENATDAQKATYKEARKKYHKALFFIHQCIETNVFDKIVHAATLKEAWNILEKYYGGDAKVKKVRL